MCLYRFTEKGNLEVLLFTIQSKMRANNQKVYMPKEGKLISDINKVRSIHSLSMKETAARVDCRIVDHMLTQMQSVIHLCNCYTVAATCYQHFEFFCQAWERLEKAEHERELALRNELIRQEKLEMLAARFDRKAAMRETWLSENQRLVSQVTKILLQLHRYVFTVTVTRT